MIRSIRQFSLILTVLYFFQKVPMLFGATIIHTNDVLGDLEPCGCRTNPQGGMVRKSNLLKQIQDPFKLQLDAGDLLFSTLNMPEMLKDQAKLQAEYLLKSMDLIHQDAVVPGEKDFSLGFQVFETLRKGAKFEFLAANLQLKDGRKYLEPAAVFIGKDAVTPSKEIRIGVIGLVGEDLEWPKNLKVTSMLLAAKKQVELLKKRKVDYVIALTHQGLEKDRELAKKVSGIDLIIGGHSQSFLQSPLRLGNTLILQSSFKNQYVGSFSLSRPFDETAYRLIGLDAGYNSPVEAPSEMDQLVSEFKTAIARLNTEKDESNRPPVDLSKKSTFQTFPQCAQCHLKQFDFWRQTPHFQALHTLVVKKQDKNKECLECHSLGLGEGHGFENLNRMAELKLNHPKTGHDYLTSAELDPYLEQVRKASSLNDEISVDFLEPQRLSVQRSMQSVRKVWPLPQCESCHSAGGDHPFAGKYSKTVNSSACLKCHNPERAPSWYTQKGKPNMELIEAKRKLVTCPAGELAE